MIKTTAMNIYIDNLDTEVSDADLRDLFATFGLVKSAEVVMDVFAERSRGFGFVEMTEDAAAGQAIAALNNSVFRNKVISVQIAQPRQVYKASEKKGKALNLPFKFSKN
jgi:RNA recognition motif-containing protein